MDSLRILASFLLGFPLFAPDGCEPPWTEPDVVEDRDDADDDDTTWPDYEGEIDMDRAIMQASCVVDVADEEDDQQPPAAGWYRFDIELEGWADSCWIEMWDAETEYCEGYDENGDPCDGEGVSRPGWWMDQAPFGYEPETGFWDSWSLELDYEHSWPPSPDKSYFTCEEAGEDPYSGYGSVWTYFCCFDMVTDYAACVEFTNW